MRNRTAAQVFATLAALALLSAAPPRGVAAVRAQDAGEANAPLKITHKEVAAVQAELQRRGYYDESPSGVLDAATREAIRTFQQERKLEVTGRIDRATLAALELKYPATGDEVESTRRGGLIPKIGYAAKDKTEAAGDAVVDTARDARDAAKSGVDKTVGKTKEVASDAADKTGEVARDAGAATVGGAKKVGRKVGEKTQRAGEVLVGRSDADIQSDVRDVLRRDERTARVRSEVKDGAVRLTAGADVDLSAAVSAVRKIGGVKSVIVVSQ
jgi:peptidoglycan hydrolase-like protein with peptidoglycan-binding domain